MCFLQVRKIPQIFDPKKQRKTIFQITKIILQEKSKNREIIL